MSVILAGTVILLGLLIILLAVPLELAFDIERVGQINGQVSIRWLFGLVRFRIEIPVNVKPKKTKLQARSASGKTPEKCKKRRGSSKVITVLKRATFRGRLIKFIKDLLRATHAHELMLRFRIGLGDPADTGQLWALLGPIAAMAQNIRSGVVRIEPEFIEQVFEFQGKGRFRLIPLEFIVLAIAFVLSPPSLHAWRTLRQSEG